MIRASGTAASVVGFAAFGSGVNTGASLPNRGAPVIISGDNVYIVWFTNESTVNSNFEVGFRASTDGGATFGPITNLSNSDNADSINTEISTEGGKVIVSWWERNQTATVPHIGCMLLLMLVRAAENISIFFLTAPILLILWL
jgi:hypothetical protein